MACQTMVLFANDAVETRYTDGTRLQLSPCGASFTLWKPAKHRNHQNRMPQLLDINRIQQRTRYVVSEHRARILQALEFRNQFASCPYLCVDIIDSNSMLQIFNDIQQISWPSSHKEANIKQLPDGTICITSIDQCATLNLPCTRQQFSVEFLCNVSKDVNQRFKKINERAMSHNAPQRTTHNAPVRTKTSNEVSEQFGSTVSLTKTSRDEDADKQIKTAQTQSHDASVPLDKSHDYSHSYVWVIQHYSVEDCPPCWRHPLQMALRIPAWQMSSTKTETTDVENDCQDQENQSHMEDTIHTMLPSSLPSNCPASHLHTWTESKVNLASMGDDTSALELEYSANGGIKVLMMNGVIYRILHQDGHPSIKIYPGDGSAIKSCNSSAGLVSEVYFNHYLPGPNGIEERMYSTNNTPPDQPRCLYSLSRVVARASRLLQAAKVHQCSTSIQLCWKISQQQTTIPKINHNPAFCLQEMVVPNVGRFSAFTDGIIRIAFLDRTLLEWRCDLGQCIDRHWKKNVEMAETYHHTMQHEFVHKQGSHICRLLLPNGQYVMVDVHIPDRDHQWYVEMAEEWRTWLNLEPGARSEFYLQQYVSNPQRIVTDELKKIQNFTYMTALTLPELTNSIPTTSETQLHSEEVANHHQPSRSQEGQSYDSCLGDRITMERENKDIIDEELSSTMIKEILSRTSKAITSIETVLEQQ